LDSAKGPQAGAAGREFVIAAGGYRDIEGRLVLDWEIESQPRPELSDDVLQELDSLRQEVAELTERMDFTERLLASSRREELDNPNRMDRPSEDHR